MPLRVTFIGAPGSGKGTQASLLRAAGFVHASTGDMLRAEIAAGSRRGQAIAATVAAGGLVDDTQLAGLVEDCLARHPAEPVVLDGYPRTLAQAEHLSHLGLSGAVFFEISDSVLLRRLADRVIGPDGTIYDLLLHPPPPGVPVTRRADDDPAVHRIRLGKYREQEVALRAYYERAGLAHTVQAERPLSEVQAEVQAVLASL